MQKPRIVIASILKPLRDPRAYLRFGISLRETNKYEINIIGFFTKKESSEQNLHFHEIFAKDRNQRSRVVAPWRFLRLIHSIRPKIVIVSTFELLPAAVVGKWIWNYKLLYDVQENHSLNISQNRTVQGWRRSLASLVIKLFESGSRRFIDHFLLAEKCYANELPKFKPASVFENKFSGVPKSILPYSLPVNRDINFLISGTLTEVYGIVEGILWFKELHLIDPRVALHVVGYAPMHAYRVRLESIFDPTCMRFELESSPIDYQRILAAYSNTDIVLMPYRQIPSISPKTPSKLFEALAMGKVCLHSPNRVWEEMTTGYPAGLAVDFLDYDMVKVVWESLLSGMFYLHPPTTALTWSSLESDFLALVDDMLHQKSA